MGGKRKKPTIPKGHQTQMLKNKTLAVQLLSQQDLKVGIGGVRKRSSGKGGKYTAGGGADIFSEENPFAGVSFG